MSRLRIIALFVALLALAAAFVACGSGSSDDPQTVVDEATLQGIESGDVDLSLSVDAKGEDGGKVDFSLSGPFQGEGEGKLPRLDLDAKASGSLGGEDLDFDGGLALLSNKAYVNYQGTEYEVDPTTFSFVRSAIEESQGSGGQGQSDENTACQEAAAELDLGDFVDNASSDGSADVGGTSTTKVSGDLDASSAIDALVELSEDPACASTLKAAGPLPSGGEVDKAKSEVTDALKSAHIDLYVGDDHIVRRISAQVSIEPKRSGSGPSSADLDFDLSLTGVNEEQSITAPSGAKPLSKLFLKLGVNPIELLGLLEGRGGGLGGLLEQFGGGLSGGSSKGGSGSGGQSYSECLGEASTPVDIQDCARLL